MPLHVVYQAIIMYEELTFVACTKTLLILNLTSAANTIWHLMRICSINGLTEQLLLSVTISDYVDISCQLRSSVYIVWNLTWTRKTECMEVTQTVVALFEIIIGQFALARGAIHIIH